MSSDPQAERLARHLAHNLRFVRERRGLTQQRLAELCDLPRSTVGQLESGAANPTLAVLARLAFALQLSIEELLSSPRAQCQHFPKGALPVETRGHAGAATIAKLLPDPVPGMAIDRFELRPGARFAGVPHRPGTREYLYCEAGRLTLYAAGDRIELAAGDVVAFQGDQPHSYHNAGHETAVGFSVVTLLPVPPTSAGASAGS